MNSGLLYPRLKDLSWILAVIVGIDQLTKELAIQWLKGTPPRIYLGNLFRLEYAENPGAFLGLGASMPDWLRFWIMTVAVAGILLACLAYVLYDQKLSRPSVYGFALVISGGFSNLLDRMMRTEGRVVDFMNLGVGELRTGIFNVADMAIMAGIAVALYFVSREPQELKKA